MDQEDTVVVNALYNQETSKGAAIGDDALEVVGKVMVEDAKNLVLHVQELSYSPPQRIVKQTLDIIRRKMIDFRVTFLIPSLKEINSSNVLDAALKRVNFVAKGGELTLLLGGANERASLIHLLVGGMNSGEFDGDIRLTGPTISNASYYYDNMAFVQRKPLYIPGITYYDMLRYAVQLKLKPKSGVNMSQYINQRTEELIELMNLTSCRNRVIPTYPELRGELGCELRRLSIALEIVDLPPLIVIDEPTLSFDPAMSGSILHCLQQLASKGHIVICSMTKPFAPELPMFDRVVVLSEGYSIYANTPAKIQEYFTSREMGYDYRHGTDLVGFVLDIASGVERPVTMRSAEMPHIMQEKFEMSEYYENVKLPTVPHVEPVLNENGEPIPEPPVPSTSAFSGEFFALFGYGHFDDIRFAGKRLITVIRRAMYTKIMDFDANRQQIGLCVLVGFICGYLQYQQGQNGHYCLSLLNFPYANTSNITSLMFFINVLCWALPWLNAHATCQKLQVYRYEQKQGCCTSFAFVLATLISEIPVSVATILIFLNMIYWLSGLAYGIDNYFFFIVTGCMQNIVGLFGSFLFCAVLKKELLVRDCFLLVSTLVALFSGFPFLIPNMKDYLANASVINPARWGFEAMMSWKFRQYRDGNAYLKTYGQQNFEYQDIYGILGNFMIVTGILCIIVFQKEPLLLSRKKKLILKGDGSRSHNRDSVSSMGSEGDLPVSDRMSNRNTTTRQSETVKPVLFMRESSVTGHNSKLSVNVSQVGDENMNHGPTVMFKDITYRVRDSSHPSGMKVILNRVSGQFDWGKLSMIVGGTGSGKTTLLHILAGDVAIDAQVNGTIMFDNHLVDVNQPLWQRCGFVSMHNELHRDLSVKQILTFAMKMRCISSVSQAIIDENVKVTAEILHLGDVLNKKAKRLNSGEWKRLCIGEEMVHGPKLLLIDEPTTDLSLVETSILLTCFREMVNQDRTVVASMHQPSAEAFKLFDTVYLLSKGRVIYHGNAASAATFFTASPFQYNMTGYTNPVDFIVDISSLAITDSKGDIVDSSLLENYYMQGEFYSKLHARIKGKINEATATSGSVDNIVGMYGGNNVSRNSNMDDQMEKGKNVDESMVLSFDIDVEGHQIPKKGSSGNVKPYAGLPTIVIGVILFVKDIFTCNNNHSIPNVFRMMLLIFQRNFLSLFYRYELIIASFVAHILLACLFGWLMGNSSDITALYNVTSLFAVGSLFLIFSNVLFAFFMYNNHQVYLKEYSRGLYSNTMKWWAADYLLWLLRALNGLIFCLVVWGITDLPTNEDQFGYAIAAFMVFMLVCHGLAECVISIAPNLVQAYISLTGLSFTNFLFSGLFLKFQSLPNWMGPWVPSLSMIRWNLQGNFINIYQDAFPATKTGFSPYAILLRLFGWGGKTKWFCFQCLIVLFCVYRGVNFFTCGVSAILRKGGRKMRM